tara:strand:- start:900 stop:2162 length:1263 start_codon:yes stop_codon:yes gene_type:complete
MLRYINILKELISSKYIILWIAGIIIYVLISNNIRADLYKLCFPPLICLFTVYFYSYIDRFIPKNNFPYLIFFSISITSIFGLTQSLTGSHAESTEPILFGLSFYSASLSYLLVKDGRFSNINIFKITNPLILFTGPILTFIKPQTYRKLSLRIKYYLPFIIIGFFFYQIIAVPLTESFLLIEETDLISTIIFSCIFEIFIYANFCGLSLIIFGLFGILGFRIPLNFKQPFSSRNIIEFWKGWHITLSTVLKTLFYNPIRKRFSTNIALLGVYLASAMWHGVTFNFLIWGIFHALMFILTIKLLNKRIPYLPAFLMIITIVIGRLIFADSDSDRLISKLLFSYEGLGAINLINSLPVQTKISLFLGSILISIEFLLKDIKLVKKRNYKYLRTPVSLVIILALSILFASNEGVVFAVYGQR